ncbi:MAG: hypothetical protein ACK5MG_05665 [Bacteroidales bacterium]
MSKSAILIMMCLLMSSVGYSQMSYDFKTQELKEIKSGRTLAGEMELKSGEILKGNLRVPGMMNKAILLKEFPSAKEQKIKAETIKELRVYSREGQEPFVMIFINASEYRPLKTKIGVNTLGLKNAAMTDVKLKVYKKYAWMQQLIKGKASLYVYGQTYGVSNGSMIASVKGTREQFPTLPYYAKMEGRDSIPVLVHAEGTGGGNMYFKECMPLFFYGDPIADKIRNKEEGYKNGKDGELYKIFNEYNARNE